MAPPQQVESWTPQHIRSWMYENRDWLQEFKIADFLWLPGSHDAGMYKLNKSTIHSSIKNTVTQIHDIRGQLWFGIRWFDIRPMRDRSGTWWCGHYDKVKYVGWQGGTGQSIRDVLTQACDFVRQNAEFVVLRFTHLHQVSNGDAISDEKLQEELLRLIYSFPEVYKPNTTDEDCLQQNVSRYINKVIVTTLPSDGPGINDTASLWANRGRANWGIDGDKQIVGLTIGQSQRDAVGTSGLGEVARALLSFTPGTVLYTLGLGNKSIIETAKQFQKEELPYFPQNIASCHATGIAMADAINDDFALTLSLAATRANYLKKKFETSTEWGNQLVVVYGGKLITDQHVLQRVRSHIDGYKDLEVTNDVMGGDPWEGTAKICVVCYGFEKRGTMGHVFYRARAAPEHGHLSFNVDIELIEWHGHPLKGPEFACGYYNILRGLLSGDVYAPSVAHFNGDDPAPGVVKTMSMAFRSGDHSKFVLKKRKIEERHPQSMGLDIDYIIWDDKTDGGKFISDPKGYEFFYWELGTKGRFDIGQVFNESFNPGKERWENDPAKGKHKFAKMRWKVKKGEDWRDAYTQEGWSWKVVVTDKIMRLLPIPRGVTSSKPAN